MKCNTLNHLQGVSVEVNLTKTIHVSPEDGCPDSAIHWMTHLLLILMTKTQRVLYIIPVPCSFMESFSLKFTFEDAFLISSHQSGTELLNFAFASKQVETRFSDNAVCHHISVSEPPLISLSFASKDLIYISFNI